MRIRRTVAPCCAALISVGFVVIWPSLSVAQTTDCNYSNLDTKEALTGVCTSGPAGFAIELSAAHSLDRNVSAPSISLKRIQIEIKERQGTWATISFGGKRGFRYEIDRCTFSYATDDLRQFLETKIRACGSAATTTAPRPTYMTGGGSWVGIWYSGSRKVCTGPAGEVEGLLTYTTRKVIGLENECDVQRITPNGPGVDLILKCYGEGEESQEKEYLEVVGGRLKRILPGKRPEIFMYNRCP